MWGNSQALRIPVEMTRRLGISANDEVILEVRENVLTVSKPSTPREGTIEYLLRTIQGNLLKQSLRTRLNRSGKRNGKQ